MIILLRNSMTLDNNNKCGWSKALDTVNHDILFRKLYELEAVCIFGWKIVKYNNTKSTIKKMQCFNFGLLFSVLLVWSNHWNHLIVYNSLTSQFFLTQILNEDLESLSIWFKSNLKRITWFGTTLICCYMYVYCKSNMCNILCQNMCLLLCIVCWVL